MTLMEFSMIPLDKGSSFSKYVAKNLEIIDQSGLDYQLNPMGTVVEGDFDEVIDLLKKCFHAQAEDADRVSVSVKIDYRKGPRGRLVSKIESVEEKVGRPLKTSVKPQGA